MLVFPVLGWEQDGLGSRGHPVTLLWSRAQTFTWSAFPRILMAKTALKQFLVCGFEYFKFTLI